MQKTSSRTSLLDLCLKQKNLTAIQRISVAFLVLCTFFVLCFALTGSIDFLFEASSVFNLLFLSGALLVILGKYVAEPFFTTPLGAVSNSIAAILVLLSVDEPKQFVLYYPSMVLFISILLCAIIVLALNDAESTPRLRSVFLRVASSLGASKVLFSVVYILGLLSFLRSDPTSFAVMLIAWVIVINTNIFERTILVLWPCAFEPSAKILVGEIQNSIAGRQYTIDFGSYAQDDIPKDPVVIIPVSKKKVRICLIGHNSLNFSKMIISAYSALDNLLDVSDVNLEKDLKRIGRATDPAFLMDVSDLSFEAQGSIRESRLYKRQQSLIGLISAGSSIESVRIDLLVNGESNLYQHIYEGAILKAIIKDEDVLFQITDGVTKEKSFLPPHKTSNIVVTARKLGKYSQENQSVKSVKWLPENESPAWLFGGIEKEGKARNKGIGVLPETPYAIPIKDLNALITHNTAILGILGVGKSCLSFELIQAIINSAESEDAKVLVIDITGEYATALGEYGVDVQELNCKELTSRLEVGYRSACKSKDEGGNTEVFREGVRELIQAFVANNESRVGIINPESFLVSRQTADGKSSNYGKPPYDLTPFADLSSAEIVRIIAEESLMICQSKGFVVSGKARLLLVFEEAHTLIPEWSSAANDGDRSASNGTARVILQGRKYGLGSLIITQRTANVSKSILNQCNTVFALRVFDDTGKQFLENYVGSEYARMLPTLEERHAVISGKALGLTTPVVIRLNDKRELIL